MESERWYQGAEVAQPKLRGPESLKLGLGLEPGLVPADSELESL